VRCARASRCARSTDSLRDFVVSDLAEGTRAIRQKAGELPQASSDATLAERIAATGQVVQVSGPAEPATSIAEQRAKLAALAKALGVKTAQ
jgi:hypothetical protein